MPPFTFSINITKDHAALIINGLNELKVNATALIEGIDNAYVQAVNQANANAAAAPAAEHVPSTIGVAEEQPAEEEVKSKIKGKGNGKK